MSPVQRRILAYIRSRRAEGVAAVSLQELAQRLHFSPSYIRQQAHPLVRRGLLSSRPGPGGGYALAAGLAGEAK